MPYNMTLLYFRLPYFHVMLYFLHSTSVLSFYIDVVLTVSIREATIRSLSGKMCTAVSLKCHSPLVIVGILIKHHARTWVVWRPTLPPSMADLVHDPVEQQDEENDSDDLTCTRTCRPLMMNLKNSSRDLSQYTGLGTTWLSLGHWIWTTYQLDYHNYIIH